MKSLLQVLLATTSFILLHACAVNKPMTSPLTDVYFKSDKWLMIYSESAEPMRYTDFATKNDWILTNNQLLDSLKTEYKCVLSKESDCLKCYILHLYKNQKYFAEFMFDDNKYFSLGQLKKYLTPVSAFEIECKNARIAKVRIDSLNHLNIPNIYSPDIDQMYQFTYSMDLSLQNVNDTTFSSGRKKTIWQNSYVTNAKQELLRLYPNLNPDNIFIYGAGTYYRVVINCNKDFTIDIAKLNNNKTIRFYGVVGLEEKMYRITYFLKR